MALRQMARVQAENARRLLCDARERLCQRHLHFEGPFQRERQQQLQAGGAGFRFGERQQLRILVYRRVVGAERVYGAVLQPLAAADDQATAERLAAKVARLRIFGLTVIGFINPD